MYQWSVQEPLSPRLATGYSPVDHWCSLSVLFLFSLAPNFGVFNNNNKNNNNNTVKGAEVSASNRARAHAGRHETLRGSNNTYQANALQCWRAEARSDPTGICLRSWSYKAIGRTVSCEAYFSRVCSASVPTTYLVVRQSPAIRRLQRALLRGGGVLPALQ